MRERLADQEIEMRIDREGRRNCEHEGQKRGHPMPMVQASDNPPNARGLQRSAVYSEPDYDPPRSHRRPGAGSRSVLSGARRRGAIFRSVRLQPDLVARRSRRTTCVSRRPRRVSER